MKRNIDYREDLKYVPHHKTGIKILDVHQLENLFPNYDSLLQRIENHRAKLQQMNKIRFEKDSQYNLMYDNIFSIFGKRGAGKTSAMFTLKKILEMIYSQDVVLPIVMPEMIPAECSMIGWILSLLEEIVDELDQKVKSRNRMDNTQFGECIYRQSDSLKRAYEKVKELGFSQFYQSDWNESFSVALINKERQTQNSFDFSKELGRFWELLKKTIQETSEEKNAKEPLIYIIFDDVDLLPEAVTTLLSTIIKYLSHPNIIVFVTADEELLYDVIENNMNEKLGRYKELEMYSRIIRALSVCDKDNTSNVLWEYFEEVSQKMQMSRQIPRLYADKVLPPSSRYYLKSYANYEDKSMFIEHVEHDTDNKDVLVTLEEVFKKAIGDYVKAVGREEDNFLIFENVFIKAYFAFWGNTSRQLVNEALILQEFVTQLTQIDKHYKEGDFSEEKYMKVLYRCLYEFSYNSLIAMGSSEMGVEEIKELLEELIVYKTGGWGIYLNYSYLRERVEENLSKKKDLIKMIQQTISLCVLLFFLENILIIESKSKPNINENKRENIHGRGILVDVLDQVTKRGESLVCKGQMKNVNEFLLFYEKILISPETLMDFDLMEPRRVRNYLNKLPQKDIKVNLEKYSRENPKWFKSIVKILYLSYEGIYEIQKKEIVLRRLYKSSSTIYNSYYENSIKALKVDLVKALSEIPSNLEEKWKAVKQISFEDEQEILFDTAIAIDTPTKSDNYAGKFTEVENKIVEKIQAINEGEDEYLKLDIYQRIVEESVGKAARTLAFLKELEVVSERLLNSYAKFEVYEIVDKSTFSNLIDELKDHGIIIPRKLKKLTKEIPVLEMNTILNDISKELGNSKWGLPARTLWESEELSNIYDGLCDCISLDLRGIEDIERAVSIIIDMQQFKTLQKYYLWSYLEERKEKPRDMRIDYESIPYKNLYNMIRKEIKNTDGSYLSQLVKRYIEEAVDQYVDKLMEG